MDAFEQEVFSRLFAAVLLKCFDRPLSGPLSEPESKHLSNEIQESTGLVIGWRSVKNYSTFLLTPTAVKSENPSVATLDTLARYVLDAPSTSEGARKKEAEHFPYWFRYRDQHGPPADRSLRVDSPKFPSVRLMLIAGLLVVVALAIGLFFSRKDGVASIETTFNNIDETYLNQHGWFLQHKKTSYWNRRGEHPGYLTLFTLKGDTWPETGKTVGVQNLLLRDIQSDCFRTEVHFADFIPTGNWQQAGLLLLEDTLFSGKSIRLSMSYNNFFGGYVRPGEVLIQGIASYGKGYTNLEEFVHQPVLQLANEHDRKVARTNLKNVAFRIEKQGRIFRILYSASPVDNFSFKEVGRYESTLSPKFVGLFALKGFTDTTAIIPVRVRYFRLDGQPCN